MISLQKLSQSIFPKPSSLINTKVKEKCGNLLFLYHLNKIILYLQVANAVQQFMQILSSNSSPSKKLTVLSQVFKFQHFTTKIQRNGHEILKLF